MKKIPHDTPEHNLLETILQHVTKLLDTNDTPRKPSEQTDSRLEQNVLFNIQRHQGTLDWLIDTQATGKVRPRTRKVLYWALAEFLYLNGAPRHAVTDAATHFVKTRHAASEAGFVNALLRNLSSRLEHQEDLWANAPEHVRLELPQELWQRWRKAYGPQQTTLMAQTILVPGKTTFRMKLWPAMEDDLPQELTPLPPAPWMPGARLFTPASRIENLGDFMRRHPEFYIQDPATLLAPALLSPQPGETVADLCAAPGGKARLIAELMQNRGTLICRDRAADKLTRLTQNLRDLSCCTIRQDDAQNPALEPQSLDALLLDVPCTNTGVLRHKPDAKWSFSVRKLRELNAIQKAILKAAAPLVRHGGRIVYSTCSVEPEENLRQVQDFLREHQDFSLEKQEQLLPEEHHDGAYAALLRRKQLS